MRAISPRVPIVASAGLSTTDCRRAGSSLGGRLKTDNFWTGKTDNF